MITLTRWNPFLEMEELQKRLSPVYELSPLRQGPSAGDADGRTVWTPAVDVIEDEKEYLIKVELPGVTKDNVKVSIENGTLTISGERQAEPPGATQTVHRRERLYGHFVRSFGLPDDADAQQINAAYKDGVLLVQLAKSEKAQPRKIEVK